MNPSLLVLKSTRDELEYLMAAIVRRQIKRGEGTFMKMRFPQTVTFATKSYNLTTGMEIGTNEPFSNTTRTAWYDEEGGNTYPSVAGAASIPIMPARNENWAPLNQDYSAATTEAEINKVSENPNGWFAPYQTSDLYYVEKVRLYILPNATAATVGDVDTMFTEGIKANDFKKALVTAFKKQRLQFRDQQKVPEQKKVVAVQGQGRRNQLSFIRGDNPSGTQQVDLDDRNPTANVGNNTVYGTVVQVKSTTPDTSGTGTKENPYIFYKMPYFYGGCFPYIVSYVQNVNDVYKQTQTKLLAGDWTFIPTNLDYAGPYVKVLPHMTRAQKNRAEAIQSVVDTSNVYTQITDRDAAFGAFMIYVDPRYTNVVTHVDSVEAENEDGTPTTLYYYPPASTLNVILEIEAYFINA